MAYADDIGRRLSTIVKYNGLSVASRSGGGHLGKHSRDNNQLLVMCSILNCISFDKKTKKVTSTPAFDLSGGWGGLTPPLVEDDPHTGD